MTCDHEPLALWIRLTCDDPAVVERARAVISAALAADGGFDVPPLPRHLNAVPSDEVAG